MTHFSKMKCGLVKGHCVTKICHNDDLSFLNNSQKV